MSTLHEHLTKSGNKRLGTMVFNSLSGGHRNAERWPVVTSLYELSQITEVDLRRRRMMGKRGVNLVKATLAAQGLSLKQDLKC